MKTLPSDLQAHLDGGATTLCWCWRLTRRDGTVMGFTDHDRDLAFDGTTFQAETGFTATEMASALGLSVDNLEAEGALSSAAITEVDIAAGLYDDAAIELWRVNWQDVTQRVLMRYGSLGEVRRGELVFVAEMRGLAHYFQQEKGRVYQYGCDAVLGDARCGVDLTSPSYKGMGTVTTAYSRGRFAATGLSGFADGLFSRGLLTWTGGANGGRAMEVKYHGTISGNALIELWQKMPEAVVAGDTFTITAGCDKQFTTCRETFGNGVNFRGFPHIPGTDYVLSYPNEDDPGLDGGSMN